MNHETQTWISVVLMTVVAYYFSSKMDTHTIEAVKPPPQSKARLDAEREVESWGVGK